MEFALSNASEGAPPVDAPGPVRNRRRNPGGRKGPNLDSVNRVGSTKRVTGKIEQNSWGERQYADLRTYFTTKHMSKERNASGCYEWLGSTLQKGGAGQASFCGVHYNAQLLFYFAMHPDEQMQPRDKVIASCGNPICLTFEHLDLKRNAVARASASAASAASAATGSPFRLPRTAFFSLDQIKAMPMNDFLAFCDVVSLR